MPSTLSYDCRGLSHYDSSQDPAVDEDVRVLELHENVMVSVNIELNLTKLSLHNNRLSTVPACVCKLTGLIWLSLHYNQLTCLPEEIGDLKNLRRLSLHHNRLTALPASFKNLRNMQVLSLFRNDLSELDDDVFSDFTQCNKLALHQNPRLCRLPTSIALMTSLEDLWIGDTGIPSENIARVRVWT